ncbi:putative repeat protein (TIGR01451 family) [Halorubrum trapanicum]|uniref:Putative repeat protein (TIGR01451 family) n=1 Tax=Halorubrum trapanicum TaxID=29284 RepID=A0A8J7UPB5_9EURY|nr:CARDB domain-containing protein [Halorubrum trapanicum]MBP1901283.1 putative repeat protein (TIGR01451 family) [Halorubrum trapanicum]
MSRIRTVAVLLLVASLLATGTVVAQQANDTVRGDPDIEAFAPETAFVPGEESTLQVNLNNRGNIDEQGADNLESEVVTAHETTARILTGDATNRQVPFDVRTGEQTVGDVARGVTGPIEFTVVPDEDAEPGVYRVPIRLEYRNVESAEVDNGNTVRDEEITAETVTVSVEITDRAQFAVVDVDGVVQAGDNGLVDVTMRNVQNETAREASVAANPVDPDLSFATDAGTTETYVESWAPGENRTFTYRFAAAGEATARASTLEFEVDYRDAARANAAARTVRTGVTPLSQQAFSAAGLNSTLRVGEDGSFTVEVRNRGPRDVENAVVVFSNEAPAPDGVGQETVQSDPNIVPRSTRDTVGDLAVGETATATFDAGLRTDANPGERTVNVAVRYRGLGTDEGVSASKGDDGTVSLVSTGSAGDVIVSDTLDVVVDVAPEADTFAVSPAEPNATDPSTVTPGSTVRYDAVVRNTGPEPISDVQAKLFVDSPLSSSDDEAFVTSLDPGEETTVTFEVAVDGGATPKTYAAAVDFRYDDADGDEQLSDTYRLPVEVVEDDEGGALSSPLGIVALLGAVAVGGALVWQRGRVSRAISDFRRRLRDR